MSFLKEHRKVQEQKATVVQLMRDLGVTRCAAQRASVRAGRAGLQKVSAQFAAASPSSGGLEASKFATGRIRRG
jgi:hypothetical protein